MESVGPNRCGLTVDLGVEPLRILVITASARSSMYKQNRLALYYRRLTPRRVSPGENQFIEGPTPQVGGRLEHPDEKDTETHTLVPVLPDADLVQIRNGEVLRLVRLCRSNRVRRTDGQSSESGGACGCGFKQLAGATDLDRWEDGDHDVLSIRVQGRRSDTEAGKKRPHLSRPRASLSPADRMARERKDLNGIPT